MPGVSNDGPGINIFQQNRKPFHILYIFKTKLNIILFIKIKIDTKSLQT